MGLRPTARCWTPSCVTIMRRAFRHGWCRRKSCSIPRPTKALRFRAIAGRASLFLSSAQHGRGGDRRIAGLDPDIDDGHLARLDRRDRLLEGRHQIGGLGHGIESNRSLRPPEPGTIDIGIGDALADPAVLRRPIADAGDALLMQLIVEERTVVADDHEERNSVMHRGPERGRAHAEVAVAADRDWQPSRALERQRGADGNAGPAADAAAALRADVIERMMKRPGGAVP